MVEKLLLLCGCLTLLGLPAYAQQTAPEGSPGPAAQKLVQLAKAGVDEDTLLAYVQASVVPFQLTPDGILALKAAGVPPAVIAAAIRKDSKPNPTASPAVSKADQVGEWELFRVAWGRIYYENRTYFAGNYLDPGLEKVLASDPANLNYLKDYHGLKNTTGMLTWGGLGLMVGGGIYAAVAAGPPSNQPQWAQGAALGAIGVGLLATIVGSFTDRASYQNLLYSMTKYNQDLVTGQIRR